MVSRNELRERLKDAGFKIECGELLGDKVVSKEKHLDDDHIVRYFPLVIIRPNGEKRGLVGNFSKEVTFAPKGSSLFVTTIGELVHEFYDLDDDEYYKATYGFTKRTSNYLHQAAASIGLKDWGYVSEEVLGNILSDNPVDVVPYLSDVSTSSVIASCDDVFHLLIKHYVPEDEINQKFTFDHYPTEDIAIAYSVFEMQSKLSAPVPESYVRSACDRKLHWTEAYGDSFLCKALCYINNYCGCEGTYEFYNSGEESDASSGEPIGESEESIEDLMADLSSFLEAHTTYESARHDEMVSECIARMDILNLSTSCITSFIESDTIMKSIPKQTEPGKMDAKVVPILDAEKEFIKEFEERNKCIVYHVTRRTWDYDDCMEIWSVGENKAEWGLQKSDLLQNKSYVWSENFAKLILSEAGYITFTISSGALLRIK